MHLDYQDVHLAGGQPSRPLSSVCAVFAQSEIVQLLAENISEGEIIRAVLYQIFTRAKSLLTKLSVQSLVLSGSLAQLDDSRVYIQCARKGGRYLKRVYVSVCYWLLCIGSFISLSAEKDSAKNEPLNKAKIWDKVQ